MENGSRDVNSETILFRLFFFSLFLYSSFSMSSSSSMLLLVMALVLCFLVAFSFRIQISKYFYVVAKSYTSEIYLFSVVAIARIPTNDKVVR